MPASLRIAGVALQAEPAGRRRYRQARPRRAAVVVAASWAHRGRPEQHRLFIFGLGYTGLGAASYFQQRGWEVAGTCRSPSKCERLAHRGIATFHFDPSEFNNLSGRALDSLHDATHVLSTVPPDADAGRDPVVAAHAQQLSEGGERYRWVGYISSTSVYGDHQGEWVDEGSELRATSGKGWHRLLAEHEWLALHDSFGLPVHIFRCGGIYGPERSAIEAAERQLAGAAPRPSAARRSRQRFTARCHVHDICRVLEASAAHPRPGAVYNIADDDPAERGTVMAYAAELLERRAAGLPLLPGDDGRPGVRTAPAVVAGGVGSSAGNARGGPATAKAHLHASSADSYDSTDDDAALARMAAAPAQARQELSRGAHSPERPRRRGGSGSDAPVLLEEKRVRNARIKQELGVQLAFPSYREGLAAIAAGDRRPFDP